MSGEIWELPLIFLSGVLGSAHCIGMCGAISATMNLGTSGILAALGRQVLWSCGRIFTYAFLGLAAAFAGLRLSHSELVESQGVGIWIQAGFSTLAGGLLIIQGCLAAGLLRRRVSGGGSCPAAGLYGAFLRGGSATAAFVAGVLTGFLPCGLVYSFLALSAAGGSLWKGALVMTAFGLGTVPVMLVTGTGLSLASLTFRRRMMRLAAVCVMFTGLLTLGRGLAFARSVSSGGDSTAEVCPFCPPQPLPESPRPSRGGPQLTPQSPPDSSGS